MVRVALDKMITALFVVILGSLWFFIRRYEIPQPYKILVYDVFGKQIRLDGIRTDFDTHVAEVSFVKHYKKILPHYDFILECGFPILKRHIFAVKIHR